MVQKSITDEMEGYELVTAGDSYIERIMSITIVLSM